MNRKILTLLIIQKDGQVLLGLKKRGLGVSKWNGFGGKVQDGESIEDAAKRELLEESGLAVQVIEKMGTLDFCWQGKEEDILEVNIFKATEFAGQLQETEEMKPQWFLIKDIPYETMWSDDKYWLPLFLEGKKFKGNFIFDQHNNVVGHELMVVVPEESENQKRIANFLYELGTMRKLMRIHRQTLLTDDLSDSITSHSYRVAMIAWFLAKEEGADPYKTVMMGLLHDLGEIRSNDHNWIHKKYVKIFNDEISQEQLGSLPYPDLKILIDEYENRQSKEAVLVKEADTLDQILLLREYQWAGNKEADVWLHGKGGNKEATQLSKLKTEIGRKLGQAIYDVNPSDWWNNLWTPQNRK